ncbi:MAG: ABC transporter ATP-binding protein [Lachnospiraceae bacterium]
MPKSKRMTTLQKILHYMLPYRGMLVLSLFLAFLTVALTLYAPILAGQGIDLMVSKGCVDFAALVPLLFRLMIVIILTSMFKWSMNLCNTTMTYRITGDVRIKAFAQLERVPIAYIDTHSHGDLMSRIVSDIDQFSDGLLMGFTQLFSGVITILGTLLFMLFLHVKVTLLVVCLTPISLFAAAFIAKKTFTMFKVQAETKGKMTTVVNEMIGNEKVVHAFSYEEEAIGRFETVNDTLCGQNIQVTFFSSLTNPVTRFVNGLVYAGVGIMGSVLALKGQMSIGQLSCFLSYANQYTKPFNEISGVITELQNALACAARVFELIEEEAIIPDPVDAVTLSEPKGEIAIHHMDFSYQTDRTLMQDVNLLVQAGQRIAIVGPTGCGKSTLINLLMRFYEVTGGDIKIDGIDIKQYSRKSLRKNYGMVLQETWLKSGTIRDNIAFGKPEASMEEVVAAAKETHAHSFIKRLPQGYDTWITEGGNLSQGQKQLLCITRVMLCLPPMLILDEATSSIDTRTELKVQDAFAKMMKGRTSFVVAHRLSTIREADLILVMDHGTIIERGTHAELLAQNGFYHKLYQSQWES